MYHRQPHIFKTHLLGRGFRILIRNASFFSPTDVRSHNPLPLGAQRPRWHTARCLFQPITYHRQPHIFKTRLLGRGFRILIKNASFFSPTDVRSHNPLPLGAQRPRWHTAPCLFQPITYRRQPHGFITHLLERGFHTLIKNALFSCPTDVGSPKR